MATVLVAVPFSRYYPESIDSILTLARGANRVEYLLLPNTPEHDGMSPWQIVTAKYNRAREVLLQGPYDYLLCAEDDNIIPPNALLKLLALKAPYVQGLNTERHGNYVWSAHIQTGPGDGFYEPYCTNPQRRRTVWGEVIQITGCGLFCTLIERGVMERFAFRLGGGGRCCDWYLAEDLRHAGVPMYCDTTVLCAHILRYTEGNSGNSSIQVVIPDGQAGYRIEDWT